MDRRQHNHKTIDAMIGNEDNPAERLTLRGTTKCGSSLWNMDVIR